jgi:hypothetical protein
MVLILVLLAAAALGGLACIPAGIAVRKGYDFAPWWAFGLILFPLALARAKALPDLSPVSASDYFSGAFDGYDDLPAPREQRPSAAPETPKPAPAPAAPPRPAPVAEPAPRKAEPTPPPPAPEPVKPQPVVLEKLPDDLPPWPEEAAPAKLPLRAAEPPPRPVEPAPRPVEPAPRPAEPAPRPVEPAPRPAEPAPRPTPQAAPPPRVVQPAAIEPPLRFPSPQPLRAAQGATRRQPLEDDPFPLHAAQPTRLRALHSIERPPRHAEASLREGSPQRDADTVFRLAVRPDDRSLVFDDDGDAAPAAPAAPSRRPGWRSAAALMGLMASLAVVWLIMPRDNTPSVVRLDPTPLPLREQSIEARPQPPEVKESLPLDRAGVAELQRELVRLGYLYKGGDDGLPGPRTTDALDRFRAERAPDFRPELDTRTLERVKAAKR